MITQKLHDFVYQSDHREIMLSGLFVVTALLFALFSLLAVYMGHRDVFWLKLGLAGTMLLLFIAYRRFGNTTLFALLFLLVIEFESVSAMFGGHFYDFVTVYPFFSIFGFFFFFTLRMALWLTLFHYFFWIAFALLQYDMNAENPVFHLVPLLNMVSTTLVVVFIGVLYHISTEITYERLEQANRQKAILIKEIHHRIKNNLNKIASILGLQMIRLKKGKESSAEEILMKNKLRIETMAMVHDALYKTNDLANVDADRYLQNLTRLVGDAYGRNIDLKISTEDIGIATDTMLRIGTIVNELLTNSIKHAIPRKGNVLKLEITLHREGTQCSMRYRQFGSGCVDVKDLEKAEGLGMTLIRLTAEEMDGDFEILKEGDVLEFRLSFRCEKGE